MENRNYAFGLGRISHVIGISGCRNVLIVVRVENLFTIRVSDADAFTTLVAYIVLESIFLVGIQSVYGYPPTTGCIVTSHLAGFIVAQCPVVEIAEDIGIILALAVLVLVVKNEGHGLGIDDVDTFLYSAWYRSFFHFSRFKSFVFGVSDSDE